MSAQENDFGKSFKGITPEKNMEDWNCIEDEDDKNPWTRFKMVKCPCPEV